MLCKTNVYSCHLKNMLFDENSKCQQRYNDTHEKDKDFSIKIISNVY